MEERHADQGHRKFWATMKEMSWKERIQHIIYYYGKYVLLAAFLIYMLTDILYDAYKEKPQVLLSGTAVNVHVSVEMEKMLTDTAFSYFGGEDPEKQKVTLVPNVLDHSNMYVVSAMQTKLLAGDYQYALMDQTALDMLVSMQALPDLYAILPKEKVDPWKDRGISVQTDTDTYFVALDITGTALAAGCTYEGTRIFLGFPVTSENPEKAEPIFDYLTAQGLLEIL